MADLFDDFSSNMALLAAASLEPNDTLAAATPLGEGSHDISGTNIDWFRLDTVSGYLNVTMTPSEADLALVLYNAQGQALQMNAKGGVTAETIRYLAPTDGTYYLKVFDARYPGDGQAPSGLPLKYRLDVDLPEQVVRRPDDPGETRATATAIGSGAYTYDSIGLDWFKVSTGPGQMDFLIRTRDQDLHLVLYDGDGNVLRSVASTGSSVTLSSHSERGGTYYLNVLDPRFPAGTPNGVGMSYDLGISLPHRSFAIDLPFGPVRAASLGTYDIDNDGQHEIVFGTSKQLDAEGNEVRPAGLVAMEPDGTIKWSQTFAAIAGPDPRTGKTYNTTSVSTAPVFSDVNGDGRIDIVVGLGGDNHGEFGAVGQPGDEGGIVALNADGSVIWHFVTADLFGADSGGPDGRPDGLFGTPVVFDIDNDGVREVIFGAWDHHLYVLDGRTGAVENKADLHDTIGASPTIADLDRDGRFEIIMPSDITDNPLAGIPAQGGVIHVYDNQLRQSVPGWNAQIASSVNPDYRGHFEEQSVWSTAQVADLDLDGWLEVITGTGNFFQDARGEYIKIRSHDGRLLHELKTEGRTFAAPLVADINGDGQMEIVAGTISGHLHAWRADGTPIFTVKLAPYGMPDGASVPVVRSPIAVDLNGDGKQEILVSAGQQIMVVNHAGQVLTSRTEPQMITVQSEGSPVARDIDGDGRIDILAGGRNPVTGAGTLFRFENIIDTPVENPKIAKYQDSQNLHEIQGFVERFYQTVLSRSGEPAGLNDWVDQLYSGVKTGADVAIGFAHSQEFRNRNLSAEGFLNVLYAAFFDRAPDEVGFATWMQVLDGANWSAEVIDGFIGSQEFARLAQSFGIKPQASEPPRVEGDVQGSASQSDIYMGGSAGAQSLFDGESLEELISNEDFFYGQVYRLYRATLGRQPDAAGLEGWVRALANSTLNSLQVADSFVNSAEFTATYGSLSDADFVTLLYRNVLGRGAAVEEVQAWLDQIRGGMTRAQVVLGFSDSVEFQLKSNPALDDYMRMANANWNDTFDSGGGQDWLNGGVGSDTFIFRNGLDGQAVIYGLEPWDNLQLSGFGFRTAADVKSKITGSAEGLVFDFSGRRILFHNVFDPGIMDRLRLNLS